jgi:hypothetical protein
MIFFLSKEIFFFFFGKKDIRKKKMKITSQDAHLSDAIMVYMVLH